MHVKSKPKLHYGDKISVCFQFSFPLIFYLYIMVSE